MAQLNRQDVSKPSTPPSSSILYFSPEPDREGHASYTHVHEIINNLQDIGWIIDYYCPNYPSKQLPGPTKRVASITQTLARAIFRKPPKLVYMRWHFAAFPLCLWARILQIPVVIEVNGPITDLFIAWPVARRFKGLFTWLMQSQLAWAAGIVPVTDGLAKLCHDLISRKKPIKVIPNGANTDHFHPQAASTPINLDLPAKFCVFFGTMAPWQGIDDLLAAIDHPNWPSDCPLLIAGDGERRKLVEEMAQKHPQKLRYLGRLAYQDLPKLVARSQFAFVCTQNLDGRANSGMAPLKLFESLACGIPVVATRMPFQEDVVRKADAGVLIEEHKPEQILTAVNELLASPENCRNMGINGRVFVEKHHSWRARAQDTSDLLNQVLRDRP